MLVVEDDLPAAIDAQPVTDAGIEPEVNSRWALIFTSGTSSAPKAVICTQRRLLQTGARMAIIMDLGPDDTGYICMPLFHSNALMVGWAPSIAVGASVGLARKFTASGWLADVRRYGSTYFNYTGKPLSYLVATPEKPDDADNPLRLAVALLPPEQHVRFEERFGLVACGSYSLTEDILSVLGPPDKSARKLGSCGLPAAPDVHRIKIIGDDGAELARGKLGEIVKQSPAIMQGYYKHPGATSAAIEDGWLHTGDLGYVDADGFLFFVDRKKDMIKRGDENISAEEVERVVNSHPGVAESAVFGVPDPIRQEELKACIVLKPRSNDVGAGEIWSHCAERLAAFKVPRYIEFLAELPKTPSSKVQKHLLRSAGGGIVFDRSARQNRR
jgi:acyl-CoA synthetase (AMP-forming)/AMP-acid ligase II